MLYVSFDIGIKNLAMCILKEYEDNVKIIDWRLIALAEKKEKIKGGVNELAERLYIELDNVIGELNDNGFDKINIVLIENQPSNLNGVMKTVQLLIYSYFNLLKHWDNNVDGVNMISATLKLQNHTYVPENRKNVTIKLKRKEQYINNKKDGIELCEYYINDDMLLKNYFNNHKKKDDLSDCLLQAISWIRKKGNKIEKIGLNNNSILLLR